MAGAEAARSGAVRAWARPFICIAVTSRRVVSPPHCPTGLAGRAWLQGLALVNLGTRANALAPQRTAGMMKPQVSWVGWGVLGAAKGAEGGVGPG